MKQFFLAVLVSILSLLILTLPAPAQDQTTELPYDEWSSLIDDLASELTQPDISDEALSGIRDELDAVRAEAREWIVQRTPALAAVEDEINALGPAPAEGEDPEPAGIAAQRQELKDRLAGISGPIKEAELIIARVGLITADLVQLRRSRFAERIFTRGPSPISPSV